MNREGSSRAPSRDEGIPMKGSSPSGALFDFLFCLLASIVLVGQPLPGGALYMAAHVAELAPPLLRRDKLSLLPRSYRLSGLALLLLSALIALALLLIYPRAVDMPHLWLLFSLVLLIRLRSLASRRLCQSLRQRGLSRVQEVFRLTELMLLFCLVLAPALFFSQATDTAWYLLGGFAFSAFIEGHALHARPLAPLFPEGETPAPELRERLSGVNAYRTFRRVSGITTAALQVTLILCYTFIATSAGDLLLCMGLAFACVYLAGRLARIFLASAGNARRDPSNVLLAGLALWLIGLGSLALHMTRQEPVWSYLSVALSTAGTTVALSALQSLDRDISDVVAFASGGAVPPQEDVLGALTASYGMLAGQMIGLIGLSGLLFFRSEGARGLNDLALQPTLLIPALILVAAALLYAFRLPLESRHTRKLQQFLLLKENGETNLPLQRQLEEVLVKVSRRHYGIKLFRRFLRPFFPSTVLGREQVRLDRDTACIFTCNHSELYGPIVANLHIPYPFRSWVISEMADPKLIAEYIYTYTVKRQRWLPERWKWPLSRMMEPLLAWIMRSIECIPVYRNTPWELLTTFKLSSAALEAGDNLLIFPENPNDPSLEKHGYLRDTVGPFFTGFVTVAQIYHKRTGKCAQFFPLYADKKRRTLTLGEAIRYDPERQPLDEQRRISDHLRREMLRMGGLDGGAGPEEMNAC
ncbi:MAG: lysophospholipid acyltransferase family protein [Christensenellales bacterium]